MGTRSLTRVMDDDQEIVCIYRQMDGYPTGHGADLKEFLGPYTIINGISMGGNPNPAANGMMCLAPQLVRHLKREGGLGSDRCMEGIYLFPPGSKNCGEEYVYTVHQIGNKLGLKVESGYGEDWKIIFDGPISDFDPQKVEDDNLD